jgi:hypothetical protein
VLTRSGDDARHLKDVFAAALAQFPGQAGTPLDGQRAVAAPVDFLIDESTTVQRVAVGLAQHQAREQVRVHCMQRVGVGPRALRNWPQWIWRRRSPIMGQPV